MRQVIEVPKEFLKLVLVVPLHNGRLRWLDWPLGLQLVSLFSAICYGAATLAILFADQIRRSQPMIPGLAGQQLIPEGVVPVLLLLATWCLVLVQTAVLHSHPVLRFSGLALSASVVLAFAVVGGASTAAGFMLGGLSFVGLMVITVVRWRRRFHAAEFFVVMVLILLGTQGPLIVGAPVAEQLGLDFRPPLLLLVISLLTALAIPSLVVAGGALAQIAVTVADTAGALFARHSSPLVWVAGFGVVIAWRVVDISTRWGTPDLLPPRLLGSGVLLVSAALLVALVRLAGRGRSERVAPGQLATTWAGATYPLAIGLQGSLIVLFPLVVLAFMLPNFGLSDLSLQLRSWFTVATSSLTRPLANGVLAVAVLVVAARMSRRGRQVLATALAAFAAIPLLELLPIVTGGAVRIFYTGESIGVVGTGFALLCLVALAVGRVTDRLRWMNVMTALVVCIMFSQRALLSDPTSALIGLSAGGALLIGMIWRLLTDGEFTQRETKGLPIPTRVLLFWASSLFAVTALAYVALTKQAAGGLGDVAPFGQVGDVMLGIPLLVTCLMLSLHAAVTERPPVLPVADLETEPPSGGGLGFPPPLSSAQAGRGAGPPDHGPTAVPSNPPEVLGWVTDSPADREV